MMVLVTCELPLLQATGKSNAALGHSAKMSFYSRILYAKVFDCGGSLRRASLRGLRDSLALSDR